MAGEAEHAGAGEAFGVGSVGAGDGCFVVEVQCGCGGPGAEEDGADVVAVSELDEGVQHAGGGFGYGADEDEAGKWFGGFECAEAGKVGRVGVVEQSGAVECFGFQMRDGRGGGRGEGEAGQVRGVFGDVGEQGVDVGFGNDQFDSVAAGFGQEFGADGPRHVEG